MIAPCDYVIQKTSRSTPVTVHRDKLKLENVAIANALQLQAARRRAVPIPFMFVSRAKFELSQPIRCRVRAFLLLICYVTLSP